MPLQFQGAPDWLLKEYLDRKSPYESISQGLNTALGTYVTLDSARRNQELVQQQRDVELAKASAENGQDFWDQYNRLRAQRGQQPVSPAVQPMPQTPQQTAPGQMLPYDASGNPITGPMQGPQLPGVGLGLAAEQKPASGMGADTPIIAAWRSSPAVPSSGQQTNPPKMGSNPLYQEYQKDPEAFIRQHGPKGVERMNKLLDTEKKLQEKDSEQPLPVEAYAALQSGTPEDLGKAFPEGIPPKYVGPALMSTSRNTQIRFDQYGNPIRVPVAGGPATSVEVPTDKWSDIQKKLTPIEYKDWQKEINDFGSDAVVKADRGMLATLNQIATEISKYNPSMTGPLKSQQARAIAREVGALTDSDIARQALDPSLIGRLKNFVSIAVSGEIPKDQLDLLRQSVETIRQSASSRITTVAQERASRKANLYGNKVSPEELMKSLNLPTSFGVPSNKQTPEQGSPNATQTVGWDQSKEARYQELLRKRGGR